MELLINMTIGGTVTACLILLIKQLLKNKLTPKWHFYIWIILALRLVIPGLPESDYSLLNFMPSAYNITSVQSASNTASDSGGSSNENDQSHIEGNLTLRSPVTGIEQRTPFSLPEQRVNLLLAGWLAGTILMAGYLAGAYLIFSRKIRNLPECSNAGILALLEECRSEAGVVSNRISLRCGGSTPMLQGILHPVILIPEGYTREELRHVLIHELCHYKHNDILINLISSAFLCVYWFNPVFWICFYTLRRDLEFLCDERAVEITGERREYSVTLLKTALRKNRFLIATTAMQNGEKEVAKRIRHLAYFKKPKLWISALAVLVVLVSGAGCLTNASSLHTVNAEIGGGYFVRLPESWLGGNGGELQFTDEKGKVFGGAYASQMDLGAYKEDSFESGPLPLPNHSQVLHRKVIKGDGYTLIVVNLDMDSETAAQTAERNAAGDSSPSLPINQNYIFLLPDPVKDEIYALWADSDRVSERELIRIAKTFKENPYPQGYQPEADFGSDWDSTAETLMKAYFKNYADADMSVSSDISGYRIDRMEPYSDQQDSWSTIYPGAAVYRVDYTLTITYPDQYSFAGGGFEVGEGNQTKIYKDQLAVFEKDSLGKARFLRFVWPQDIGEMGEANAIIHTINYAEQKQDPEALLKLKMPYIGDHTGVGKIIAVLPLAEYGAGIELQTKEEPYGLIVNYDMTSIGDSVFLARPDRALTDSSGWDTNPYIRAQLEKNSAILLALIDNCSTVDLRVTGISEFGVPYTYDYLRDRTALQNDIGQDPRSYTDSLEEFTAYMNTLEERQMGRQGI